MLTQSRFPTGKILALAAFSVVGSIAQGAGVPTSNNTTAGLTLTPLVTGGNLSTPLGLPVNADCWADLNLVRSATGADANRTLISFTGATFNDDDDITIAWQGGMNIALFEDGVRTQNLLVRSPTATVNLLATTYGNDFTVTPTVYAPAFDGGNLIANCRFDLPTTGSWNNSFNQGAAPDNTQDHTGNNGNSLKITGTSTGGVVHAFVTPGVTYNFSFFHKETTWDGWLEYGFTNPKGLLDVNGNIDWDAFGRDWRSTAPGNTRVTIDTLGEWQAVDVSFTPGPNQTDFFFAARNNGQAGGMYLDDFMLAAAGASVTTATWNVDNSGSWSVGGNWTPGVPNGVDHVANFGSIITAARTITVDSAVTVGTINFNNANAYTLNGAGTITMDVSSGNAVIAAANGSHVIAAPIAMNDNLDLVVANAADALSLTGSVSAAGKAISKSGAGAAQLETVRAASLGISAGTVKISAKASANNSAGTSKVGALSITGGALDLTNNSLVIDYAGGPNPTLVTQVRQQLAAGTITTSAATPAGAALGYADNAALASPMTSFGGISVDTDSLLVKFTYRGDADLDGSVGSTDFNAFIAGYGTSSGAAWVQGDFDYDGKVSTIDFNHLAGNFGLTIPESAPSIGTVVPEPMMVSLAGVAILLGHRRRR